MSIVKKLEQNILGPGLADQDLRKKIFDQVGQDLDLSSTLNTGNQDLDAYLTKVTLHPYKILDREIDQLNENGYSEDQIFELTVTAAVSSGLGRFNKALELLNFQDS